MSASFLDPRSDELLPSYGPIAHLLMQARELAESDLLLLHAAFCSLFPGRGVRCGGCRRRCDYGRAPGGGECATVNDRIRHHGRRLRACGLWFIHLLVGAVGGRLDHLGGLCPGGQDGRVGQPPFAASGAVSYMMTRRHLQKARNNAANPDV